eukprot:3880612-Pyramimonas_sp.AAC.1
MAAPHAAKALSAEEADVVGAGPKEEREKGIRSRRMRRRGAGHGKPLSVPRPACGAHQHRAAQLAIVVTLGIRDTPQVVGDVHHARQARELAPSPLPVEWHGHEQ